MLSVGSKAPNFSLKDKDGNLVSLSDFNGKKVVVYFYPKDNTPGCSKQAQMFKEYYNEYLQKGVVVIGISKDSISSHKKFSDKYELPFVLLSDPDLNVISEYGVWGEKKMCGKNYMGVIRTTYIIDEAGFIEKVYEKVKPDKNAEEILCDLN